jgi:penicillin-binding protein 1A
VTPHRKRRRYALLALLVLTLTACSDVLRTLPTLEKGDLRFDPPQTTRIFASDGRLIAELHAKEDRTVVPLKRVPRHVRHAVIAIEDRRFFDHDGVDIRAIVRAATQNFASGEVQQGGSTITQQLVKNTLIRPRLRTQDSLNRKIKEVALARQIEERLPKNEILRRYINTVYFGHGSYGIQTAAQTTFGKSANDLTLAEAATLAGLIRSPAMFDPFDNRKRALRRRNLVLSTMLDEGFISQKEARKAKKQELDLAKLDNDLEYPAPYFIDYVKRLLVYDPRFKVIGKSIAERSDQLFKGGLRIYTTADLDMQVAAEEAISSVLPYENDPHGALVALDPRTGEVRAMVGGRDYFAPKRKDRFAKLNLAIAAEPGLGDARAGRKRVAHAPGTGRQAGSAFKPFALAAAVDEGISLSQTYEADSCMDFPGENAGGNWRVCNYEESAFGSVSLLDATINSINVVYAQLILEVGAEDVVETARRMGINTQLSEVPSAALGTNPVNPLDMASAFGSLATGGMHHPPVAITKIVDSTTGKVLYQDDTKARRVLEPTTAYLTTSALEGVIESGTGTGAQIGRPAAGKTGTAQEYRDAWFVGFTPQLATSVWVGYPEGSIEMKTSCLVADPNVCRPTRLTVAGGTWPATIWQDFMADAVAGMEVADFDVPEGATVTVTIDTRTGCVASSDTPDEFRVTEDFVIGTEPTTTCAPPAPKKDKEKDGKQDPKEDRGSGEGSGEGSGNGNKPNQGSD